MSAKHTPGPWKWRVGYDNGEPVSLEIAAGVQHVASILSTDGREDEFNARLIAAAPELLEALKALLQHCVTPRGLPDKNKGRTAEQQSAFDATRAAIAKAEGRET